MMGVTTYKVDRLFILNSVLQILIVSIKFLVSIFLVLRIIVK